MSEVDMLAVLVIIGVLTLAFLGISWLRSVDHVQPFHKLYSLSMVLFGLFFVTWIAQGISEWNVYESEQKAHGESVEVADYMFQFAQSTFENWQSEFLQLFAFVTLSAIYIHKGSGESKDGDEEMKAQLDRIERKLDT